MHRKGLVIGILTLLIGVNIGSTFAGDVEVKTMSSVCFDGNTLYVGGSGPNNYTTIQSAIDNASDGDTIFVFDDSSPYYEGITINRKINLIGEDKNTTTIIGDSYDDIYETVSVTGANVVITEFNIIHLGIGQAAGTTLNIDTFNTTLKDNIISCEEGDSIYLRGNGNNIIVNNSINSNGGGIFIRFSSGNNTIINNDFIDCDTAITLSIPKSRYFPISSSIHFMSSLSFLPLHSIAIRRSVAKIRLWSRMSTSRLTSLPRSFTIADSSTLSPGTDICS